MSSEDTAPAVLHPPAMLGGLGENAKKQFDAAWLKAMSDWPESATQKEKEDLYDEMHGQVLEGTAIFSDDHLYEKKVKKSGLTYEQYDSLADAFKPIAKQHPIKETLQESSLEKYKRIKSEMEAANEKRAAKKFKKEIKDGKQKVITSFFRGPSPNAELENDEWFLKRSKHPKRTRKTKRGSK